MVLTGPDKEWLTDQFNELHRQFGERLATELDTMHAKLDELRAAGRPTELAETGPELTSELVPEKFSPPFRNQTAPPDGSAYDPAAPADWPVTDQPGAGDDQSEDNQPVTPGAGQPADRGELAETGPEQRTENSP